jgi:hypothetical protein
MAKGILYVESRPDSPEQAAAYHKWYEQIHMPEMIGIEGFVSARRFASLPDTGSFVAIYEIDADDIGAVAARLEAASGQFSELVGVQLDPPPVIRFFQQIAAYAP